MADTVETLQQVPEKVSFVEQEEKILQYWKEIDAFQTSLKKSEGKKEYIFYDGPPFATGLPHWGTMLVGTIKDTVTRYAHQTGHHVTRRFGWDCHGLPVEFEIEKQLGIKTREEVLAMGIAQYNAHCRSIVTRYTKEWEVIVERLGRWIDFKQDYKTMDITFMESVWWVFRRLWEEKLVYRGFKVMPYSTACNTPLSNFEANLNYKEVSDPEVVVTFPKVDEPDVYFLAWTTTPWTLPSNLALCVNPDKEYVRVKDEQSGKTYILMEARLVQVYKKGTGFTILSKFKGSHLVGNQYVPLFDYFAKDKRVNADFGFRVYADNYVTDDSGTGIVHQAPAFGEDDYRVCIANNVISKGEDIVCPVDMNGNFTSEVGDFAGKHVKDADKEIVQLIKKRGRLIYSGTLVHSYPYCWRSETPLIYKAVPSWFVAVEAIKEKILANNLKTRWVPEYVQMKRFHNWLQDARDWAVSRNRYFGTPLPIWTNDQGEIKVVGSVAELEALSGVRVSDLHREFVDPVTIPSEKGGDPLRRVDEVFDCWFESGSMPYGQWHYPFENKDLVERNLPADFIAEGLDQTRGWFYTLMVISSALFDRPAFSNCIVSGLVLASDGKKMSKRLKNYPDIMHVVNEYGADAIRLYMLNSPAVRADNLRFSATGVRDIVKDVFLPWFNAYRFFVQSARLLNKRLQPDVGGLKSSNTMDVWILASTQSLIQFVRTEMAAYRLYTVVPRLLKLIDDLTNWFIRFNRKRLKGHDGVGEAETSLRVLYDVLLTITIAMAPFTPFLADAMYQNLKRILPKTLQQDSVHFCMFPEAKQEFFNARIEESVSRMQQVVCAARLLRDRQNIPVKFPVRELVVVHRDQSYLDDITSLASYVTAEVNARSLRTVSDEGEFVLLRAEPDNKILGKRLGKAFAAVSKAIKELAHERVREFQDTGKIVIDGHELGEGDLKVIREFKSTPNGDHSHLCAQSEGEVLVLLDVREDVALRDEGLAREVVNRVQKLRKKIGLVPEDEIEVFYWLQDGDKDGDLKRVLTTQAPFIASSLKGIPLLHVDLKPAHAVLLAKADAEVGGAKFELHLTRATAQVSLPALVALGMDADLAADVASYVAAKELMKLKAAAAKGPVFVHVNGKHVQLCAGKELFFSAAQLHQALPA